MIYIVSVKLASDSKELRMYLRQNRFNIYRYNRAGICTDYNEQEDGVASHYTHYQCVYNGDTPPSQAVFKRLYEEPKEIVLGFQITAQ